MNIEILRARGLGGYHRCTTVIDTGSNRTFVSESYARNIRAQVLEEYPEYTIQGLAGPATFPAKKVRIILEIGNQLVEIKAITLPGLPRDLLIGTDYICNIRRTTGFSPY